MCIQYIQRKRDIVFKLHKRKKNIVQVQGNKTSRQLESRPLSPRLGLRGERHPQESLFSHPLRPWSWWFQEGAYLLTTHPRTL